MAVTRRTARRGCYPVICHQIFLESQTSQQNRTSCQENRLYSPPIDLSVLKKFLRQLTAPATGKPDWPWVITAKHFLHGHLAPKADPLLCTAFAKERDEQHFIDIILHQKLIRFSLSFCPKRCISKVDLSSPLPGNWQWLYQLYWSPEPYCTDYVLVTSAKLQLGNATFMMLWETKQRSGTSGKLFTGTWLSGIMYWNGVTVPLLAVATDSFFVHMMVISLRSSSSWREVGWSLSQFKML